MKPKTIQRLDDFFAAMPVLVAEGVAQEEVEAAEREVGAAFDADYREFLLRYGGAMVGSLPILGLRQAEVMGPDTVVDVTARFRADGWSSTERWVVISMDLGGNPIGMAPDGGILVSDHDAGQISKLADSFEEFVIQLLDESGA